MATIPNDDPWRRFRLRGSGGDQAVTWTDPKEPLRRPRLCGKTLHPNWIWP